MIELWKDKLSLDKVKPIFYEPETSSLFNKIRNDYEDKAHTKEGAILMGV